jgi:hypothetical protein
MRSNRAGDRLREQWHCARKSSWRQVRFKGTGWLKFKKIEAAPIQDSAHHGFRD